MGEFSWITKPKVSLDIIITVHLSPKYNSKYNTKYNASPAKISTLNQCCFNVVHQWNNVDPTIKQKQTSDLQHFKTLIQRQRPTLKQRCRTLHNVISTLFQHWYKCISTLFKTISKPIGLVISIDLQIDWYVLFY